MERVIYDDIFKMPQYNWFKVMSTGSLVFLYDDTTFVSAKKVNSDGITEEEAKKLSEKWHELNDQFFEEFGQSELNKTILEKKRQLGLLKAKYLITGNKMNLTLIEIKEQEIKMLDPKSEGEFNYNKEVRNVSKYIGKPINLKEISVYEYNNLKESLRDGN